MSIITDWNQFKFFFASNEQPVIQEINLFYQNTKGFTYFSQFAALSAKKISADISSIPGATSTIPLYVQFSTWIYNYTYSVSSGYPEDKKWEDYVLLFPEEFRPAVKQMTVDLRKASKTWAIFVSDGIAGVESYLDNYAAGKIVLLKGFVDFLIRKREQICNGWTGVETSYIGEEQLALTELSYYLQRMYVRYPDFKSLTTIKASQLAGDIRLFNQYYNNPRRFANFFVTDFLIKAKKLISDQHPQDTIEEAFINQFRPAIQGGVRAFISSLRAEGIILSFYDIATIPALTGVSDTRICTGDESGYELQDNGDFSKSSGGWYNSSGVLITGFNGDSGSTLPYTGSILTIGKKYRVQVNVLTNSPANTIKDYGGTVLYTSTYAGTHTFTFVAAVYNSLHFDITRFTDVSISEVMDISCDPVVLHQAASTSLPQISYLTPQGSIATDDVYMLRINNSSNVFYKATSNSIPNLIAGLVAAINTASVANIDSWSQVTASNSTTFVTVTANGNNQQFDLEVISLKRSLLKLPAEHLLYNSYASELIAYAVASLRQEYIPFQFTGNIIPNPATANTSGYTIRASYNGGINNLYGYIGSYPTQSNGNYNFIYNLPKPFVRDSYILIELLDKEVVIAYNSFFVVHGQHLVYPLYFTPTVPTVVYPDITYVASQTGLVIPPALATFLATNYIITLKDIRRVGGLKYISGLPVSPNDPAVIALDAHAELNTISYNILVNQELIDDGFTSLADIAGNKRGDMVIKFLTTSNKAGGFNGLNIYTVARSYTAFLQSMINAHRSSSLLSSTVGTFPELDTVLEEKCNCDDCDAAVSPLAYLTDLVNYSAHNLTYSPSTDIYSFLENRFYQDFNNLPTDCSSTDELICQQRIVVEILCRYLSDPAHTPTTPKQVALNSAIADYCRNAYKYLLNLVGTSYEEIRNVRTGTDFAQKKTELADNLNIPYSDTFDPFTILFRDIKIGATLPPDEQFLELVFGLKDSTRDVFSTGLKIDDSSYQLLRWKFEGIDWNKNTDQNGYLYLKIVNSIPEVLIYKNAARDAGNLIATATYAGDNRYTLSPENESNLTGELFLDFTTDNSSIYISVIPLFAAWQQLYLRSLWTTTDHPKDSYISHTLPIIDPDIIGPDDFRKPENTNNQFVVWKNRAAFVKTRLNNFITAGPTIAGILDLMDNSIAYTRFDSTVISHIPWSAIPDFNTTLSPLYLAITTGDSSAYNAAVATITGTYKLTVPSFQRFYELYRQTLTNDGKGAKNVTAVTADVAIKQITNLYFTGIKRSDSFRLEFGTYNSTTHDYDFDTIHTLFFAAGPTSTISDVLIDLAADAPTAGGNWSHVTVTNTDGYLKFEATTANIPFAIRAIIYRSLNDTEIREFSSILTQAVKQSFFADWITEENLPALTIHINSADYWPSLKEPVAGDWPPLVKSGVPLIDPELINIADMAEPTVGAPAIALWYDRVEQLEVVFNTIQSNREQKSLDAAFSYAWGDGYRGTYKSLNNILIDLNNISDPVAVAAAITHIETVLLVSVDEFRQIMNIVSKNTPDAVDTISMDEWNSLYSILTTSYKKRVFYTNISSDPSLKWLTVEASAAYVYWQVNKATLPPWRASSSDRSAWKKSITRVRNYPVLDPDLIRPDFLRSIDNTDPTYALWKTRNSQLNVLFGTISSAAKNLVGFNSLISTHISPSGSALLISLLEESKDGTDINSRLVQLNLNYDALDFLVNIYYLIQDDAGSVLDGEWNEIYSIMLQVEKERTFSLWNEQEQDTGIQISPDQFKVSVYKDDSFYTEAQQDIVRWRIPEKNLSNWINTLEARTNQAANIYSFVAETADKTEEEWIQSLRDALIFATDVPGTHLTDKAKTISDKLLIDAKNNCCQKITRVSQAIETLQGIFFSLRNGIFQDTYPGLSLSLSTDHFDKEWEWMGSYATWRAAMFVNIYPENLLYPTLRNHQSYGFSTLCDKIRNSNNLSPSVVCDAVYEFFKYFEDMSKLALLSSCTARTLSFNGDSCASPANQYRNFVYLFTKGGKTNRIYYSTLDADDSSEYAHGSWVPIVAFDKITNYEIIGSTKWNKSANDAFVLLFCLYQKEGVYKIGYALLNLSNGNWAEELVELDVPPGNGYADGDGINKGAVNNVFGDESVPVVYIVLQSGNKMQKLKLDKEGKKLLNEAGDQFQNTGAISQIYSYTNYKVVYEQSIRTDIPIYKDVITYFERSRYGTPGIPLGNKSLRTLSPSDYQNAVVNQNVVKYETRFFPAPVVKPYFYTYYTETNQVLLSINTVYTGVVKIASNSNSGVSVFGSLPILSSLNLNASLENIESCFGVFPADSDSLFFAGRKRTGEYIISEFTQAGILTKTASSDEYTFMYSYEDSYGNLYLIYQLVGSINSIVRCRINATSTGIEFKQGTDIPMGISASGPFRLTPSVTPSKNADYKSAVQTVYLNNLTIAKSEFQYIQEAYYFVPMMCALSLQDEGYFTEALDWFRLVYDYSIPSSAVASNIRPRKIWYGLIAEENGADNYNRLDNWLNDPINPHALAEIRPNSYTRYTVMSIVQCMLAYADSEYTKDTAESVPRARLLYEEAIELLNEEQLVPAEEACTSVIENLEFIPTGDDLDEWPEWQPVWYGIVLDLYKIKDKDVLLNTINLIETEIAGSNSLEDKMSYCRDLVDDALATPEQFENVATLLGSNHVTSSAAMLRLLLNPQIGQAAEDMGFRLLGAYLNAVSLVTGLPEETLTRTDFYLNWFSDDMHRINDIAYPDTYNQLVPIGQYPLMTAQRNKVYYNYVAPSYEQILTLSIIKNPIRTINEYYRKTPYYVPQPNISFCVPPNPILNGIRLSAEVNLYKLRNCMNIAGIVRQLNPYAAPTDQSTGIPVIGSGGQLNLNISTTYFPSQYRYDFLIERAKQQQQIAQQLENTLLSLYERYDAEMYNQLKARQDIESARAGVKLQDLRVKEAGDNITLAQLQKDRVNVSYNYYNELINQGFNTLELISLVSYTIAQVAFTASIAVEVANSLIYTKSGNAFTATANLADSRGQYFAMLASFARRQQEWKFQQALSAEDLKIADQQIRISKDQYDITAQERQISQLDLSHTEDSLAFLTTKFTNAELYDWMGRTLSKVYAYFLRQATSTALSAAAQLAFERQTTVPAYIKNDYWASPSSGSFSSSGNAQAPDRRGLTGSTSLLQDIYQLDQYALDSDVRKLNLTKNISLASIDPVAFQRFRETGVLRFATPSELFDHDFPGHYLRLIKQVKVSVIALIPPVDGIKASLSNSGISYVVNGNSFKRIPIVRTPEKVALTSPFNATGMFELTQQSSIRLNPFESIGTDTAWEFLLPKAANFMNYNSIADVLFTIEYTALESPDYRNTVIKELHNSIAGARPFSFKNNLSDQWYELSNPVGENEYVTISFDMTSADFPANLNGLKTTGITLYVATDTSKITTGIIGSDVALTYKLRNEDTVMGPFTENVKKENIISTQGGALKWGSLTGQDVTGTWTMQIRKEFVKNIQNGSISDLLFVVYYEGDTARWV